MTVLKRASGYIHNLLLSTLDKLKPGPYITDNHFEDLAVLFGEVESSTYEAVFSPSGGLIKVSSYGRDINAFISSVDSVADSLLLDKAVDQEGMLRSKSETAIRNIFIGDKGEPIEPTEAIDKLKRSSVRLARAVSLRLENPACGSGVTDKNLQVALDMLQDLNDFYRASSHEYRTARSRYYRSRPDTDGEA